MQAVVIEKLPFEVPTELRRRREERIRELGLNAFERYRLGKMLLYLKQMTGRLIRSEDDRGIVVIVEGRTFAYVAGEFELRLAAGSYRIDVVRGFETVPRSLDFEVSGSQPSELRVALERWSEVAREGW